MNVSHMADGRIVVRDHGSLTIYENQAAWDAVRGVNYEADTTQYEKDQHYTTKRGADVRFVGRADNGGR